MIRVVGAPANPGGPRPRQAIQRDGGIAFLSFGPARHAGLSSHYAAKSTKRHTHQPPFVASLVVQVRRIVHVARLAAIRRLGVAPVPKTTAWRE